MYYNQNVRGDDFMKRLIALVLVLICVIALVGCNSDKDISVDGTSPFFIAKVVEIREKTMLVKVTHEGNTGMSVESKVSISTEKIAGVIADDRLSVTDNYLRIEFDGVIMESYPLQLGEIFKIVVTNANGVPIE